jgi:hypothetical protein
MRNGVVPRIILSVAVGLLGGVLPAGHLGAQPAAMAQVDPDEKALQDGSLSLIGWARRLMGSLAEWASSIDRSKMVSRLKELNTELFALRDRKSLLLSQLEAGTISDLAATAAMDSLARRIRSVGDRVTAIGGELSNHPEVKGADVASLLSNAAGGRKVWLEALRKARARGDATAIRAVYASGRQTIVVLDSATSALGAVIAKLDSTP